MTTAGAARLVLYEDNHLLAMNKPPGLSTQESPGGSGSLEETAREYVREAKAKPGNVYLHAVHRLDRGASGVVLFSTTSKALARLNTAQRARAMTKIYHAVVDRDPPAAEGKLTHHLKHGSHRADVVLPDAPGAREATLTYRLLASERGLHLLEVTLLTGRYHQIRAQLAEAGMPIVGDEKYGGTPRTGDGFALHHARLEFEHPVRHVRVRIEAPYPDDFPLRG